VGDVRVVPGRVLGRAPIFHRSGGESLCGGDVWRADTEIHAEGGSRSGDVDRATGEDHADFVAVGREEIQAEKPQVSGR
jgi:hypothetical protein